MRYKTRYTPVAIQKRVNPREAVMRRGARLLQVFEAGLGRRPVRLLEGLPAAVVLIPVVFPIATRIGVNPIHFDIVQTAAVGIGLFLPPMGVGLLMALRFAEVSVGEHARGYWPYVLALLIGLMLIICLPELSLMIPRSAGFVR